MYQREQEIIERALVAALSGEQPPDVLEAEAGELMHALSVLLNAENSPQRVGAFWFIALAGMRGLAGRLRAAAELQRLFADEGRLH